MTAIAVVPAGAATGIGSLPGTDFGVALRAVLDTVPDLPYLPELPARGPGADLVGRAAGLLVELPVDLWVGRWRIAPRPGRDARRIADLWDRDLDELAEVGQGYTGAFKLQCAGPWTLAAALQRATGGPLLADPGAVRDLVASLAEGLAGHVREVRRRLPGAIVLVQLDEPSLPAALAARVPTESGLYTLRAVGTEVARDALRAVIDAAGVPVVVHCCAPDAPVALLRAAGAAGVALDLDHYSDPEHHSDREHHGDRDRTGGWASAGALDPLGELLDGGGVLLAGAVPTTGPVPVAADVAARVAGLWSTLGFALADLPARLVVTPACGLADNSPQRAAQAQQVCRDAAVRLHDDARS